MNHAPCMGDAFPFGAFSLGCVENHLRGGGTVQIKNVLYVHRYVWYRTRIVEVKYS